MTDWQAVASAAVVIGAVGLAALLGFRVAWATLVNAIALTMRPGKDYYDSWRWQVLRRYVIWRDARRCQVCRKRGQLDVHHVRPISRNGSHFTPNLIAVHRGCHARLHGRKPW